MNSKVEAYIGFAIKKGAAVFGCDLIKASKRKICVILYTPSLSENSLSTLRNVSEKLHCKLLQIDECATLTKRNCKALAVCDPFLANAITENLM